MLRRFVALVVAVATTFAVAGCGGAGSAAPAAGPASQPASPSEQPCPTPAQHKPTNWPARVPEDLPKPPDATMLDHLTASDGVHIVKFQTPTSLRESVIFVVERLPKAGYVLGRGDAEASEADAPFVHGNVRGLLRMVEVGACQTQWLLATVVGPGSSGGSPLLPPHTPSGSPSPLPFG